MRKRLHLIVMASVTLLLASVALLVGRSLWQQRQRDLMQHAVELLPGVSQHIQDFRRVKVQEGRKVWEVAATDAQYFDEDKTVVVRGAVLQWFLKDGRTVGLKGDEGRIILDGRDIKRIELTGAIEVALADYQVRTERAIYDHERGMISAPGSVAISGRALELRGDGLDVDVNAQRLTLLHDVSMRLQPAVLRKGDGDVPR